jgi:hypothetical protein
MVSPKSFHIPTLAKRRNRDGASSGTRLRILAALLTARRQCRPADGEVPGRRVMACVGGISGGVVTLAAAATPRIVVTASWADRTISVTRMSEREAPALANAWIDLLAAGREPTA